MTQQSGVRLSVAAELDVPGETGRQARVFIAWLVCLALAVIIGSALGAHVPISEAGTPWAEQELSHARGNRIKIGFLVGFLLPVALTFAIGHRYRRGGGHARGITVDVTDSGELRIWGRGYGTRVTLHGATVNERLVDMYAGRLGAWRERRLAVRASRSAGPGSIEIATLAVPGDDADGLRVEGGEGDCVEIGRDDYDRVRALVFDLARTSDARG